MFFDGTLRPSQRDVAKIAREQLERGERRLHIVAPPGSGKTVVGLYLWAECVRQPALVLSPNSAIQAQWAARTSLFKRRDEADLSPDISTSSKEPGLLTSLTYQSVTMPAGVSEELDERAIELWIDVLLENNQAESYKAGEIWIGDLRKHNPDYYSQRLGHYRKKIRDDDAVSGRAIEALHASARATLERLRDVKVGLLILDECHHLMGHWGRVLAEVEEFFGNPVIVGLTATPPDRAGKKPFDIERYDRFFGAIDYEVPVPAVVKDGFLAPYQDLAYFVRRHRTNLPTSPEPTSSSSRSSTNFARLGWNLLIANRLRRALPTWMAARMKHPAKVRRCAVRPMPRTTRRQQVIRKSQSLRVVSRLRNGYCACCLNGELRLALSKTGVRFFDAIRISQARQFSS